MHAVQAQRQGLLSTTVLETGSCLLVNAKCWYVDFMCVNTHVPIDYCTVLTINTAHV